MPDTNGYILHDSIYTKCGIEHLAKQIRHHLYVMYRIGYVETESKPVTARSYGGAEQGVTPIVTWHFFFGIMEMLQDQIVVVVVKSYDYAKTDQIVRFKFVNFPWKTGNISSNSWILDTHERHPGVLSSQSWPAPTLAVVYIQTVNHYVVLPISASQQNKNKHLKNSNGEFYGI